MTYSSKLGLAGIVAVGVIGIGVMVFLGFFAYSLMIPRPVLTLEHYGPVLTAINRPHTTTGLRQEFTLASQVRICGVLIFAGIITFLLMCFAISGIVSSVWRQKNPPKFIIDGTKMMGAGLVSLILGIMSMGDLQYAMVPTANDNEFGAPNSYQQESPKFSPEEPMDLDVRDGNTFNDSNDD